MNLLYLGELSIKDRVWDRHKSNACMVADNFRVGGDLKKAIRMDDCCKWLDMAHIEIEGGYKLKLRNASFCRVRECPVCQWRKSLKWKSRVAKGLPKLVEDFPKHRWILLTLTMPNCPIKELRTALKALQDGFSRLTRLKAFPGVGWIKAVEITRNVDTDEAHPHIHALIMVAPSYFSGLYYLSQAKWSELWRSSMRFDFNPIVHVTAIAENKNDYEALSKSICEVTKYAVKECDLVYDSAWLMELANQTQRTRSVSLGGIFREYFEDEKDQDDLIFIDENNTLTSEELDNSNRINFHFNRKKSRFVV